ncbi:MAG: RNA methyltransferase [Treponema sp.]|jgi:TrmH RNA methyltransferase|nr:RNA methyltransferase [Treponema sp.]
MFVDELAVCGFAAVKALSDVHPEKINRLFMREEMLPRFTGICKSLAERKRPYKMCEDEELERICKSSHHEGIVAMIEEPLVEGADEAFLDDWSKSGKNGLLLCNVENEYHTGAVIRCAAFFDAPYVVITRGEGDICTVPPKIYRVACGGMEQVAIRSVRNPAAFLKSANKFLISIGTDPRARIRIHDLPELCAKEKRKKSCILVFAGDAALLPAAIKENCSLIARIPGTGNVENLDISQQAALLLQELYER